MKVLLVCAGGMSTSILMKKLEKYAVDQGIEFEIAARGLNAYQDIVADYDCVLLGPQVGYRKAEVEGACDKPVAVISPADYGIGNCANIFKLINETLAA